MVCVVGLYGVICLVSCVWWVIVWCFYMKVVSEVVKLLFSVCRNVVRFELVVILFCCRFDSRIDSIGMKNSVMFRFCSSCIIVMW